MRRIFSNTMFLPSEEQNKGIEGNIEGNGEIKPELNRAHRFHLIWRLLWIKSYFVKIVEVSNTDMPDHGRTCDKSRKMCEKTKTENEKEGKTPPGIYDGTEN